MKGLTVGVLARPGQRGELTAVLIGGALGAGAVLLASRQDVAKVIVRAPRPLPDTVTAVTSQDVRPAVAALAVAALASIAAVIATSGRLRRLTGLVTVALAAWIAAIAAGPVTAAAALAAADRSGAAPAGGSGAGTAAGSVTAGNGAAGTPGSLAGLPVHVMLAGSGWRAVMIAGAVLVAAAGIAVILRAAKLPAMSARYDRPASQYAGPDERRSRRTGRGQDGVAVAGGDNGRPAAAGMWEALSAGSDPTAGREWGGAGGSAQN